MRLLSKNPNAVIGGVGGGIGLGTLVVWLLNRFFDVDVSPEIGAVIAGFVASVVLFIGRNGIRGIARYIWSGGYISAPAPPKKKASVKRPKKKGTK